MIDYYIARCSEFIKEELTAVQKAGAIVLLLLIGAGWFFSNQQSRDIVESKLIPVNNQKTNEERQRKLFVHTAGQVNSPGLYELVEGRRVMDAIKLAGGPAPNADLDAINLAEPVTDGMKITVPDKSPAVETPTTVDSGNSGGTSAQSMVNINTANESELDSLPGVGPATAKKIMDHRQSAGRFKTIDGLKNVKGIGAKKFEELKSKITIY